MGKNDWAVVVGIDTYYDSGSLGALLGPENDAQEFYQWVVSPTGGDVPEGQAKLILSSQYKSKQPFASPADAMPTAAAIKLAFDHLQSIAEENDDKGIGLTVGDRLYIFMAGHGFAPSVRDELTALLTAEASVTSSQLTHVIGSYMADWFWRAAYFKQIFLFMDCCRTILPCTHLFEPYRIRRGPNFDQGVRFYANGARPGHESREWTPPGGKCHGVFTMTLMNGLRGAAYDPRDPKHITAESLRDYLYNDLKNFMVPGDREKPDVRTDPEVQYEHRPGRNPVVAPVPPKTLLEKVLGPKAPQFPVRITAAAASVGKAVDVQNWTLEKVASLTLQPANDLQLERGYYLITGNGIEASFEVTGQTGVVDVAV